LLTDAEVSDFDIYFRDSKTAFAVAEYYVKKLKENPPAAFKDCECNFKTILEPVIAEGEETVRAGNLLTKGPQPERVRIVVETTSGAKKNFRGEEIVERHKEYQDFQYAEGQVTDDTEPGSGSYEGNAEELDDIDSKHLDDKKEKKNGKYRVLFVTANAITLSDKIQIVLRFQGDVNEIHSNYDFTHCTNAWTSWDKELHLRIEALKCIMAKELVYQGSKYPIASMIRTRKFITRGWTINAGQYVKMAFQVAQLDLNNPAVLEDQLVGVDSAYFSMLIQKLNEDLNKKLADNPNASREVDSNHVITLIDKIF
jgi:hypothetical protein